MLETNRLTIRKFTDSPSDLAALFSILSDVEVNTFLPMFPLKNLAEARAYFHTKIIPANTLQSFYLAICLKENNLPIGYIALDNSASHDLGYGLAKNYWGQGVITEAATAMLSVIKQMKLPFITATHDVNNPGSGRVMQKIGLTYRYSYEELWQPKNILVTFRLYQLNFANDIPTYHEYWEKYEKHFVEKI